jgi:hypothetical protein
MPGAKSTLIFQVNNSHFIRRQFHHRKTSYYQIFFIVMVTNIDNCLEIADKILSAKEKKAYVNPGTSCLKETPPLNKYRKGV